MRSSRAVVLALAFAAACRCGSSGPGRAGPPFSGVVDELPDPYRGLPPRGGVPALERAAKVLQTVGASLGYDGRAAASLRAHAGESWDGRLILFLDHGGTDQLDAAFVDLSGTTVASPEVPMATKADIRRAQARLGDLKADQPSEEVLRRHLLAEIAWIMVLVAPAPGDGGK